MNDQTQVRGATFPTECQHQTRTRDIQSGYASAETVCSTCGQVFDAEQERQLRDRDHARARLQAT